MATLYCLQAKERFGLTDDCCGSCHSDDEDGYSGLCDGTLPDGTDTYLCCKISNAVDKKLHPEEN